MGQQFEFICPQCGYEAFVAGGFDCGMMSAFVTIVCRDCRELCDVGLRGGLEGRRSKGMAMNERAQRSFWMIVVSCLVLSLVAAWTSVGGVS